MISHHLSKRLAALAAGATLALTACSPASNSGKDASSDGKTTVTFRLWDDTQAPYYEESFKAFEKQNPSIKVKVEVIGWANYWDQLPLDISSGDMADIFLVNSSNYAQYADNGNLLNISEEIGDDHEEWQQSVVDLYTRDGSLWGVPQLWDSIGLFYNKDLVEEAGVDVNNLTWAPDAGEGDTLLAAAQALTTDANGKHANDNGFDATKVSVYGFNAQADMQAIYLPFFAEAGATYQAEDGSFAFASPEGEQAISYLVDMINEHHVAPSAADTNTNGDSTRDMFVQGKLALYQSGPYNLKTIADTTDVNWGLAPLVAGPEGAVSTIHGVVAVGNAGTKHKAETVEVLKWLGSAEGQAPLAENGVAFPGVVSAQQSYVDYWTEQGVDVNVFIDAANGKTTKAPVGPAVNAGAGAYTQDLLDTFLGTYPVSDGLKRAQDAGNAAMK